jgi:chromosome partitioning protein
MESDEHKRNHVHVRGSADRENIANLADRAEQVIQNARAAAMQPSSEKVLRRFTLKEATDLLGVHPTTLYELWEKDDLQLPKGEKTTGSRLFSLEEIHRIQEHLQLLPRQKYGIRRAVAVAIANFKGGVAKTFTSVCAAQYFSMHGYRTCLIDIDPQGSSTSTFGIDTSSVQDRHTVAAYYYGKEFLDRTDPELWTGTLKTAVQPTYWHGLDIVAANLMLYESEFALGMRQQTDSNFKFFSPLRDAIESIREDYDVIIIDTPPSLSFSTTAAIAAADGLVIPAPAAMLDLESGKAFLTLLSKMMEVMANYGFEKRFDFLKVLISKYQSDVSSQRRLAVWTQSIFGEYCLEEAMLSSKVIENLGPRFMTLYEARAEAYEKKKPDTSADGRSPPKISRAALKRALESVNAVNGLIEADVVRIYTALQSAADSPRSAESVPNAPGVAA